MSEPSIPLTNGGGIESVSFRALYDAPLGFADVTAVAPATDRSTVGRKMSTNAAVAEHKLGYALEGTPADYTVAESETLCSDVDMVVSGINKGANIGAYILDRSGTVSAAVEAAFFDVPAITLSLYVPAGDNLPWHEEAADPRGFREVTNAASHLVKRARPTGAFGQCDYPNINAPVSGPDGGSADIQVTILSELYDITAEFENGTVRLHDRAWERVETGDTPDPDGTDRQAVAEGCVSVSSPTAPCTTHRYEALDALVETYLE